MRRTRGAVGVEVLFLVSVVFVLGFASLVSLLRMGNEKLIEMDSLRIEYDGKVVWKD